MSNMTPSENLLYTSSRFPRRNVFSMSVNHRQAFEYYGQKRVLNWRRD